MTQPIKNKADFRVMIVYPNLFMMLVPSLAVAIFTRLLKKQGYVVDLFETTQYEDYALASPENRVKFLQARNFDYEKDLGISIRHTDMYADFRRRVLEFKPDAILISAVEDVFLQAVQLLEQIEDLKIPNIMGGVFPTAASERCLDFSVVQRIARGEGETVVLEFTERVRLGQDLDDIPGVLCCDRNGDIRRNANLPLVNINLMRPDFSLFEEARFYRPMGGHVFKTVPVETYRGCPYDCTFCNSPMQRSVAKEQGVGNFLRRKTMESLREELEEIRDSVHPEFIYFIDDSFLARPKKEIFDFCDMYAEFGLPFWFNTRPENCDADTLRRLREVGCYRISFGVECGNEEYRRKVLRRYVSNKDIIKSFDVIHEAGIPFSINLIIGFPGETRELVMDTVALVRSFTGYDTLTVSIFTPYHGTHLRAAAVHNGWLDPKTITKHTTSKSLLKMPRPYLSSDDIDGLVNVLPLYCYFPKTEWAAIRRAEIPDEEGKRVLKHYQDIYRNDFLRENQEAPKVLIEGGTGCRSNPKDSFFISPKRLSDTEIRMLNAHAAA